MDKLSLSEVKDRKARQCLAFLSTNLAHELYHAEDANFGLTDDRRYNNLPRDGWRASYFENQLRSSLGYPYRSHYNTKQGLIRILDANNKPISIPNP